MRKETLSRREKNDFRNSSGRHFVIYSALSGSIVIADQLIYGCRWVIVNVLYAENMEWIKDNDSLRMRKGLWVLFLTI